MNHVDVLLLAAGLLLTLVYPFDAYRTARDRARRRGRATGVTVGSVLRRDLDANHDGYTPGTYRAEVEYQVGGRTYRCISDSGVSWKRPPLGQRHEVHFDPANPADGEIYSALSRRIEGALHYVVPTAGTVLLAIFAARQLY